ncbi:MAG: WXG100 family type VII secretion target [Bacilli bacterium]|nr:WXG100 family type VII secretion target [Bacilli bacterium]
MATNFNVTPQELLETSKVLGTISADFLSEVKSMYNSLDDLISKWQGSGASQYYQGLLNRKGDVETLGVVIGQYSTFTGKAAVAYSTTDDDIASAAGKF